MIHRMRVIKAFRANTIIMRSGLNLTRACDKSASGLALRGRVRVRVRFGVRVR